MPSSKSKWVYRYIHKSRDGEKDGSASLGLGYLPHPIDSQTKRCLASIQVTCNHNHQLNLWRWSVPGIRYVTLDYHHQRQYTNMHHPNHRIGLMRLWLRSKNKDQQIGESSKPHRGQETRHISHREPDLGSIMPVVLTHFNLITGHVYVSQRPKSSGTSRCPSIFALQTAGQVQRQWSSRARKFKTKPSLLSAASYVDS